MVGASVIVGPLVIDGMDKSSTIEGDAVFKGFGVGLSEETAVKLGAVL